MQDQLHSQTHHPVVQVVVVLTDLLPICATIMQSANIVMSGGTITNTTTRKTRDTPPRA